MKDPELIDLAKLALQTLEQQQKYFRTKSTSELATSKKLEGLLRARCREIVAREGQFDFGTPLPATPEIEDGKTK